MLVLTRKANEQILIGDDIKITLVRIRGNCVRVGIEAPRDIRVVRGELRAREQGDDDTELEFELGERETVFAHPQRRIGRHATPSVRHRLEELPGLSEQPAEQAPRIIVGRVRPASDGGKQSSAPLADFVSAT